MWLSSQSLCELQFLCAYTAYSPIIRLSWADTAASTIGRLWGRYTPRLPSRLPLLRLPLAPRKSVAGFIAGSLTGAAIAAGFWGLYGQFVAIEPIWTWEGVAGTTSIETEGTGTLAGWVGLGVISALTGIVSGVAEALGKWLYLLRQCFVGLTHKFVRPRVPR